MRNRLDRMNDWCHKFLNNLYRYDDLITFVFFSIMFTMLVAISIAATLGIFGVITCGVSK